MYEKGMYEAGVGGDEDYSELLPSVNRRTGLFPPPGRTLRREPGFYFYIDYSNVSLEKLAAD